MYFNSLCAQEQNSRCHQSHYFVPVKTIDLFGGQNVVQITLKMGEMFTNIAIICGLAFGKYLVFDPYSLIFTANSIQNKVIML